MTTQASYYGFPPLPDTDEIVEAILSDPPEIRWRWIRAMLQVEDPQVLDEFRGKLLDRVGQLKTPLDNLGALRVQNALHSVQRPVRVQGYAVVQGKGAYTTAELEAVGHDAEKLGPPTPGPDYYPVVDFHVHPKMPDLKFLSDMHRAGITHAVILATDTDPDNLDRPEIVEDIRASFARSPQSQAMPFEKLLKTIRRGLYSRTHVTDQDVADWVADFPDVFIGFGSVDLCKSADYVKEKLDHIEALNLKGIKLLPYSQFFNPAEDENMALLFDWCQRTGSIVLSHTGCAAGAFEIPELSKNSRPELWEGVATQYPDVPIVLAHFASYSSHHPGIWFQEAVALMKKCPNVNADISAAHFIFEDDQKIKAIREATDFKQVLFATDYPGPMYHGIELKEIVDRFKIHPVLTDEEKRRVFGGNAQQLLGLADRA